MSTLESLISDSSYNPMPHHADDLVRLFNQAFSITENTRLVKGLEEPIYLPAADGVAYARIVFAHGFFASAMHEIAHWCVAGKERRKLADFGYWYKPDGRTNEEQALFEQVEVVPQAFEWILSMAAGYRFSISADNLIGENRDDRAFKRSVLKEVERRFETGLPDRLSVFVGVLQEYYSPEAALKPAMFLLEDL